MGTTYIELGPITRISTPRHLTLQIISTALFPLACFPSSFSRIRGKWMGSNMQTRATTRETKLPSLPRLSFLLYHYRDTLLNHRFARVRHTIARSRLHVKLFHRCSCEIDNRQKRAALLKVYVFQIIVIKSLTPRKQDREWHARCRLSRDLINAVWRTRRRAMANTDVPAQLTKLFFICYLGRTITLLHRRDNRANDKPALSRGPPRSHCDAGPRKWTTCVCQASSLSLSPLWRHDSR